MAQRNNITILSTFAKDKLFSEGGVLIRKQEGGPALFLKQALKNDGQDFVLQTGPKMEVEILVTEKGEFGKISRKLKSKRVSFSKIKTSFLIISSLLDEYDLAKLPTFKGKVFLDIQGYVRNGKDFGKKKIWKPDKEIFANIFCLKGTKEEMQNLPTQYIQQQKQKLLLITNGKHGCEVFAFGKRFVIKPSKVVKSKDTIGAGDTFFAYFISRFAKTENTLGSARYAINKTSQFLSAQNDHRHNQLFREEIGCG